MHVNKEYIFLKISIFILKIVFKKWLGFTYLLTKWPRLSLDSLFSCFRLGMLGLQMDASTPGLGSLFVVVVVCLFEAASHCVAPAF